MTDLKVSDALRCAIEIRYYFNCSPMPWEECVFAAVDQASLSEMSEEVREALIDKLSELGPCSALTMEPIIQEHINRG